MVNRTPYAPGRDLLTETVKVGVSLETKLAVEAAAHRAGRPVAALVRDAVEEAIARAPASGVRR